MSASVVLTTCHSMFVCLITDVLCLINLQNLCFPQLELAKSLRWAVEVGRERDGRDDGDGSSDLDTWY